MGQTHTLLSRRNDSIFHATVLLVTFKDFSARPLPKKGCFFRPHRTKDGSSSCSMFEKHGQNGVVTAICDDTITTTLNEHASYTFYFAH